MTKPSAMREEIDSIPTLLRERSATWAADAARVRAAVAGRRQWVTVGRGSSGHAATFFGYLAPAAFGRPPIDLRPAAVESVPAGAYDDTVVLAYSASGRSADVAAACAAVRKAGAFAVTVDNASGAEAPLRDVADLAIDLAAGAEAAVPATRSFVSQLVFGAALAGVDITAPARNAAAALEALADAPVIEQARAALDGARVVVLFGRGGTLAAVEDGALKIAETARSPAAAWSSAEIRHGPVGSYGVRDAAIGVLDDPEWAESVVEAAAALRDRGVPVLLVGDPSLAPAGVRVSPLPGLADGGEHCPVVSAVVSAVFFERVALAIAEGRGLDPDAPPGLSKVTLTR